MHSAPARALAARLGLRPGRPNIDEFADTLLALAQADPALLALTSDSRGSARLAPFARALPRQLIETGIAEQNLVGLAAGLAAAGKTVFAVSPASFLATRALEQIKTDIAYSAHPATLVGISAGVSYGALGATHHSLHDFAALRAIPGLRIAAPADNLETRAILRAAAAAPAPLYLRLGKAPLYDLPAPAAPLDPGRARLHRPGRDAAFIATGETVIHALLAAAHLRETAGLDCRVLGLPTLKPLDTPALLAAARECPALLTVEEHSIHGGLGEACAALIAQSGAAPRLRIAGLPDEHLITGSQAALFRHYGLNMEGLAAAMLELLADA
jgi:transketolase